MSKTYLDFTIPFKGEKALKVGVRDLLSAPVDVIVNPANSGLSHGGGLAAVISEEAGPKLDMQCEKIIERIGRVPVTQNQTTTAGRLPYKGIIHAVGPRMGDGNEQEKIEKTIVNCLRRADQKGWQSIAFPAISTGLFFVPRKICAQAFRNAIPSYWQRFTSCIDLVWLCLTTDDYPEFEAVFQPLRGLKFKN